MDELFFETVNMLKYLGVEPAANGYNREETQHGTNTADRSPLNLVSSQSWSKLKCYVQLYASETLMTVKTDEQNVFKRNVVGNVFSPVAAHAA